MRIGIFTDTYRPSVNGIVYVTEILRHGFEKLGHEVYIFAPGDGLNVKNDPSDPHLIRFPALHNLFQEVSATLLFPPAVMKKVKELDLDVLHFLTPGPVGLTAMYAAHKLGKPVVAEYCTDLFEYAERYPASVATIVGLALALPFTFKVSREQLKELVRGGRPRSTLGKWNQEMVKNLMTVIHQHCDAVIVHSRKSATQLRSWLNGESAYPIYILPTGVDALPKSTAEQIQEFKTKWHIAPTDEVVQYVGRLGVEKNLDMLIGMIGELAHWRPHAKLMIVGSADYREALEAKAKASPAAERIVFTGKLPRESLATAHAVAKVFVFPSMTDTQALAIHEAAQSGLPIVMVDEPVTEVVRQGHNGYFSANDPIDMAAKVRSILEDPALGKKMGAASKKLAGEFSEVGQAGKIIKLYEDVIQSKTTATDRANG